MHTWLTLDVDCHYKNLLLKKQHSSTIENYCKGMIKATENFQ